jgi:cytoskeletal protein CcmA (bactofilin family)
MFFSKNTKMHESQRGFTLVVVLILSGLASILVLSSMKDNVNQERLSGNFQKKLNARLTSEQGIFDAIAETKDYLANNPAASVNDLVTNIGDLSKSQGADLTLKGVKYKVQLSADNDELVLSSTGNRFEGESSLKVRLKIVPGGGSSGFTDAIVGCDKVTLGGSGKIDSFDSSEGPYNKNSAGAEGGVSTINKNGADVILGGGSPIYGDINSTGKINTGTSKVDGNLHANGNIIIGNNVQPVSGNVRTRGNYTQAGGQIGGYVRANGNVTMGNGSSILNNKEPSLPDILYGGIGTFIPEYLKEYKASDFNRNPNVEKVKSSDETAPNYDPTDPTTNCDFLNITSEINKIDDGNNSLEAFKTLGWTTSYTMLPNKLYKNSNPGNSLISSVNANVFGVTTNVLKVTGFKVTNDTVVVKGDVTLFVDGNFEMTGNPKISIQAGSSLTLIITGKVNIPSSAKIIAKKQGLTQSGLPAFRIFSSYKGAGAGIKISGAGDLYAQIYAPLSDINIAASGNIYGAVRGKTVTITGDAGIHYDTALGTANQGTSSSQQAALQFIGFEY